MEIVLDTIIKKHKWQPEHPYNAEFAADITTRT